MRSGEDDPLVPKPLTSGSRAAGRFDERDFVYNAKRDMYRCPAGERAIWRYTRVEDGLNIRRYWPSACPRCPLKARCTTGDYRRITRAGSTNRCSRRCSDGSIAGRRSRACGGKPSSTRLQRLRRG